MNIKMKNLLKTFVLVAFVGFAGLLSQPISNPSAPTAKPYPTVPSLKFLIIGTSLNPDSHSQLLAQEASKYMKGKVDVELIDLRKIENLPFCHGLQEVRPPFVMELMEKIKSAHGVLIATPVYGYSMTGATKNFVEITREGWDDKVVAFVSASGGVRSWMALTPLMNSLMLNSKCVIVPNFVHAPGDEFDEEKSINKDVVKRVQEVAQKLIDFTYALKKS